MARFLMWWMIFLLTYTLSLPWSEAQLGDDWKDLKGDHFVIYYQGIETGFPERVLRQAEKYYDSIASELGYARRDNFWLWDNRCSIYLYETKENFHEGTKQAEWSSGFAIPNRRIIVSYEGSEEFLESVLPHELGHLIFRDFVGIENAQIPLWMDEGLAMAQESAKRAYFDQLVQQLIVQRKWIPISQLNKISSLQGITIQEAAIFYAQSQSLVRYLLDSANPSHFIQFCRDVRDGKTLEDALGRNYPKEFPTLDDFQNGWIATYG